MSGTSQVRAIHQLGGVIRPKTAPAVRFFSGGKIQSMVDKAMRLRLHF